MLLQYKLALCMQIRQLPGSELATPISADTLDTYSVNITTRDGDRKHCWACGV